MTETSNVPNLPYFDLSGKVAVVTGGATGIGKGIAEGLAEAGANIVIGSRRLEKCKEACQEIGQKTGAQTLPLACDVTDSEAIKSFVVNIVSAMGQIDILVNNSGVEPVKSILEMDEADWDITLNTNLKGIFTLSKEVVKKMIDRGAGGKIINVASIAGIVAGPSMSAYCASKGGCIQLTKVMALEWVKYNIQVNSICPGYFETPMVSEFVASEMGKKFIKNELPMRRVGQVNEIKGVAILLASQASSYITGASYIVDGGITCR